MFRFFESLVDPYQDYDAEAPTPTTQRSSSVRIKMFGQTGLHKFACKSAKAKGRGAPPRTGLGVQPPSTLECRRPSTTTHSPTPIRSP